MHSCIDYTPGHDIEKVGAHRFGMDDVIRHRELFRGPPVVTQDGTPLKFGPVRVDNVRQVGDVSDKEEFVLTVELTVK
jgi:hypothetical protein